MDHSLPMGMVQGVRDLGHDLRRFAESEAAAGQGVRKTNPRHKLGDDVWERLVPPHLVDRDDAGMVQSRGTPCLAHKTVLVLLCRKRAAPRYFDRDDAVQLGVPSAVDGSERAPRYGFQKFQLSQPRQIPRLPRDAPITTQAEGAPATGANHLLGAEILDDRNRVVAVRAVKPNGKPFH